MKRILTTIVLIVCLGTGSNLVAKPTIDARAVQVLVVDDAQFKDLNKNMKLDVYEDWRQPVEKRIEDLVSQMTLTEKAGMLLINTLNADPGGVISDNAPEYIEAQKMTRFVFRNTVTARPTPQNGMSVWRGAQVTPYEAAQFMNGIQEISESTRLGIPALFKSNARNHFTHDARAGINVAAGSFSAWPKEAGLAATRDMDLIAEFAKTMAVEWTAIGLRGMYGYMADLATEPRWYRIHETFTEDSDLAADIMSVLVTNLQGKKLGPGSVALTMKHFPGGGPQEGGADPHYEFGKNQTYPTNGFVYHLKPFKAAIDAGVSSLMPYYGIPVGQKYLPNDVGMAFSKGILTDLLRGELGYGGYINSDTGIIGNRAWGLEGKSIEEQIAIAIDAGTDVLSGFDNNAQILGLVESGLLTESRLDLSVTRLLREQFELGLFENPYVDADRAGYLVGNRSFQRKAEEAQRKSIVLLQTKEGLLPIKMPSELPLSQPWRTPYVPKDRGEDEVIRLYTMGMNAEVLRDLRWNEFTVVSGDYAASKGETRPAVPENTDYAIIRVNVSNDGARRDLFFGGPNPEELNILAFSDMVKAKSWKITPSLADIQAVMNEARADKTILSIYFRQPFVLDEKSGLRKAGAILATFGVGDAAILDVLTGKHNPTGKLPFSLANNAEAVKTQDSDAPGYRKKDTLFPFGHGLTY
ncbi:MAG: glycoside hydrolase family 3 N-terminal domain-containing protein [Candidatus Latescibacterota bacterium]|nr:glycoside hydrolase family 3 N-terminal domain-containing protein [Candidatus Latescibacterota bacterium]